eukprot:JP436796.1.p2 GENE.JP436796.1~~JP436796.1.p2  ORF type:complete len:201 (-),score=116.84 JP436796.1:14-616(-)
MYSKKGKWAVKNKTITKKATKETAPAKAPRFYPAEKIPHKLANNKKNGTAKLRSSITPGTVLIILSGRFRGKRVVFLSQLPSGLLLITGPYKVNGVPLHRVNQAYVIATSTKVDISGVTIPASINDAYFAKPKSETKKKSEKEFFAAEATANVISEQRKSDQKAVDAAIITAVKGQQLLKAYLSSRFTLTKGQNPHELVF